MIAQILKAPGPIKPEGYNPSLTPKNSGPPPSKNNYCLHLEKSRIV
jgi:hypothetical protein